MFSPGSISPAVLHKVSNGFAFGDETPELWVLLWIKKGSLLLSAGSVWHVHLNCTDNIGLLRAIMLG